MTAIKLLFGFTVVALSVVTILLWGVGDKTKPFEPYEEDEEDEDKYQVPPPDELDYFDFHIIEFMKYSASPSYLNHPVWVKAFEIYNKNHKPVSALCTPCYFKVLQYIIKLKNEKDKEKTGNPGC